jgi:hypothetical protein
VDLLGKAVGTAVAYGIGVGALRTALMEEHPLNKMLTTANRPRVLAIPENLNIYLSPRPSNNMRTCHHPGYGHYTVKVLFASVQQASVTVPKLVRKWAEIKVDRGNHQVTQDQAIIVARSKPLAR